MPLEVEEKGRPPLTPENIGIDGIEALNSLRAELTEVLDKLTKCKSQNRALERENTDLRLQMEDVAAELKDTRAMLGQAIVAANRGNSNNNFASTGLNNCLTIPVPVPEARKRPTTVPEPSPASKDSKRIRSPSLEIVDHLEPPKKKTKNLDTNLTPTTRDSARAPLTTSSSLVETLSLQNVKNKTTTCTRVIGQIAKPTDKEIVEKELEGKPFSSTQAALSCAQKESLVPAATAVKDVVIEAQKGARGSSEPVALSINTTTATSSKNDDVTISTSIAQPRKLPILSSVINALDAAFSSDPKRGPPPLKIDPPALNLEVPRTFLRVAYGGSDQHFLQFIQKEMNPSAPVLRRIVFPMLDMNPTMPSKPGEHGFVFASRHEILHNLPWTLFCKRDKSKAVWQYLGEYENVVCGKVEAETFAAQTMEVKLTWGRALLKSKGSVNDVYIEMRARIALRKYGLIPLEDKDAEEEAIVTEVLAIKADKGRELTPDEVISAICRGDESIDLIQMTCVKYDHVFANDMAAKFPNYATLLAASKQKQKSKKLAKMDHVASTSGRQQQMAKKKQTRKSLSTATTTQVDPNSGDIQQDQRRPKQTEASGSSSSPARRYSQRCRKSRLQTQDADEPDSTASSEESLSEYEE